MKNKILKSIMTIVIIIFLISCITVSTQNIIPQIIFIVSGLILSLFILINKDYFEKRL